MRAAFSVVSVLAIVAAGHWFDAPFTTWRSAVINGVIFILSILLASLLLYGLTLEPSERK
jgi:hypothetical protein